MNICDLNLFVLTEDNDSELIETLMRDAYDICDHYAKKAQAKLSEGQYIEIYDDENLKSWYYLNNGEVVTNFKEVIARTKR